MPLDFSWRFNKINAWNFLETLCLEVIASRSTSLREELWMYKSDSDGFFSTIVVYRPKITTILLIVECSLMIMDHMEGSMSRCMFIRIIHARVQFFFIGVGMYIIYNIIIM